MYSKLKIVINQLTQLIGFNIDTSVPGSAISDFWSLLHVVEIDYPFVRIGSANDGGYVVPDILDEIKHCASFGVSDNCDLEVQMAERGMQVHAIDGSIDFLPSSSSNISFTKKYVGREFQDNYIDVNTWVTDSFDYNSQMMFAMDIEEAEWEVILDLDHKVLERVDLFIIELHGLHLLSQKAFYNKAKAAITKLNEMFTVVNVNHNNTSPIFNYRIAGKIPSVVEVTYLANRIISEKNIKQSLQQRDFRLSLNRPNFEN